VVDSRTIGNPFIPGQTLVPVTNSNDLRPGTRVEVSLLPAIKAKLYSGKIKGSVSIFDAVGNMVAKDTLAWDDKNGKLCLYYIWDGRTRKASIASAGTYVARVLVEDLESGKRQSIRMTIGLKH
jgi:hypothetical protein